MAQLGLEALARSMSTPMSVGRVSTRSELRGKRRATDLAANVEAGQRYKAREDAARSNQFFDRATPFWEYEREPFSLSRTRSFEEFQDRRRFAGSSRECFPHSANASRLADARRDPSALDARHAFQLSPDDKLYLHRKLTSGPITEGRGYPRKVEALHADAMYGSEKPVRQSRELLMEASLTTSKDVKSKNVKWTTACFRIKATPSDALDGCGAHLSVAAQERVRTGMPHKARNLD